MSILLAAFILANIIRAKRKEMLSCENLIVRRGETVLIDRLGVSITPGSLLFLTGPNGAGKTTLLETFCGLRRPASGKLTYEDYALDDVFDEYRELICYVPHQPAVKSHLTVLEQMKFWSSLYETEMLVPSALSFWELEAYADTPCRELSAGFKRRVGLARLLLSPAQLWFLDEPTSNLDAEFNQRLQNLVITRCNQGGTAIIAAHDLFSVKHPMTLHLPDFKPETEEGA